MLNLAFYMEKGEKLEMCPVHDNHHHEDGILVVHTKLNIWCIKDQLFFLWFILVFFALADVVGHTNKTNAKPKPLSIQFKIEHSRWFVGKVQKELLI